MDSSMFSAIWATRIVSVIRPTMRKKQKNTGAKTNITFWIKLRLPHERVNLSKKWGSRFF
jgi:hypothetical protein